MYNLQRIIKTQDTKNIPVQNKYNSPDGWEMEYLTFPGLTKTGCVRHLFTTRTGGTTALTEKINVRATGDDLKTTVVDFLVDEDKTLIWAYQEDAIIVPKSLGGSMDGVNIPFEIHYNGNRKRVNLDLTTYAVSEYSAG